MKITMTPEEKFNKNVGYVLQKIKERELYTKEGQPILYGVTPSELFGVGISHEEEIEVLEKLQEWGTIKNLKETEKWNIFSLEIIRPKFDKFCKKREEIDKKLEGIDENPWLLEESKIIQKEKLFEKKGGGILKKEIIEETNKTLEEQKKIFEKLSKQISSQSKPIKDALEQVGRLQSGYVKNYLTPALQRLAPYLKQAEEEIKRFNEIYRSFKTPYFSKAIISSDLIEIEQRNQIISEIRDLRKLVEELQTKNAERKQEPLLIQIVSGMEGVEKRLEAITKTKKEDSDSSSKIIEKWFNHKNNSIGFRGEIYKPRNEPQAKFIRQLVVRHQRENNNGTVLKEGQRVSEKNLSNEINLTIEQLRHIKKQLKRSFKDKGFPLKIDLNTEGILLIYII